MKPKSPKDPSASALDNKLQAHIGNKLKQFYDEIVSETVPDRFKMLLDQLEQREAVTGTETESGQ